MFNLASHWDAFTRAREAKKQADVFQEQALNDFQLSLKELQSHPDMPQEMKLGVSEKETNMTREEAIKALSHVDITDKPINDMEKNYVLIKKLEALGLIKFDVPVKKELTAKEIIENYSNGKGNTIILNLEAAGYLIVKLGKQTQVRFTTPYDERCFQGKLSKIDQEQS